MYDPFLDTCILSAQPTPTKLYWGCWVSVLHSDELPLTDMMQVVFDFVAITIGIMNSLDKPYRQSSDVIRSLQHDGAAWLVVSRLPVPVLTTAVHLKSLTGNFWSVSLSPPLSTMIDAGRYSLHLPQFHLWDYSEGMSRR